MRLFKSLIFGFFVLLFFAAPGMGQTVSNYIKKDSVKVGDEFTYSIVLKKDTVYNSISFPDSSAFGQDLIIKSRKQFRLNAFSDSLVYTLQYFGIEDLSIPPLPVTLNSEAGSKTLRTSPVFIPFSSVLPAENAELKPPKPIFEFPRALWPYMLAAIILLLAGYYLYKYWKRKSRQPKPEPPLPPPPFINPLNTLEMELQSLHPARSVLEKPEATKAWYIKIGDAIRSYLETAYRINALESTTREILRNMHTIGAEPALLDETRKVLYSADMVKFAKFSPDFNHLENTFRAGIMFLEQARSSDVHRIEMLKREHSERYSSAKPEPENLEETAI